MKILLSSQNAKYRLVWAASSVLDDLWRLNRGLYLRPWSQSEPPCEHWIPPCTSGFHVATVSLCRLHSASRDRPALAFQDGRHRTRWLMQFLSEVPLQFHIPDLPEAKELGLFVRDVSPDEALPDALFTTSVDCRA